MFLPWALLVSLSVRLAVIDAFLVSPQQTLSTKPLGMAKGFGEKPTQPSTPKPTASSSLREEVDSGEDEERNDRLADEARERLKEMEQEREDRLAGQRQRVEDIKAAAQITKEDPSAGVIPEKVSNRMLKRMIPFFILPVISELGVFGFYFIQAKQYDTSFQPSAVAFATTAPLVVSLFGITYAIISSSWDEDREGSFVGGDEVKKNLGSILEGLRRTSDKQELLDQMEQDSNRSTNRATRRMNKED
ncbi:unnamed protein product [Chrysoparadoxa australica]